MESQQIIIQQMKKRGIKRNADVTELFIAESGLTNIVSLAPYRNLHYLWLAGNKLRRISCLTENLRLSELYLHDNELVEVTGALSHLTSLQVLMLHNNQLEKLERVIQELKYMNNLKTLNLFSNAVAQETGYRVYVIHHIPSLLLLDRQEVHDTEREQGIQAYDQDKEFTRNTIAFGRISDGPPAIHHPKDMYPPKPTVPVVNIHGVKSSNYQRLEYKPSKKADFEVGNNFYRDHPPYPSEDQAMSVRCLHRSIMQRSYFDWSKLPRATERRLSKKPFTEPQIITTRFR